MVGVVQLAEHWIVVPGVVGSSPITHPIKKRVANATLFFYGMDGTRKADQKTVRWTVFPPWESPLGRGCIPSGCRHGPKLSLRARPSDTLIKRVPSPTRQITVFFQYGSTRNLSPGDCHVGLRPPRNDMENIKTRRWKQRRVVFSLFYLITAG